MNESILNLPNVCIKKKIARTTYIVSGSFNGDKKHDVVNSFARLIERDILTQHVQ